MMKAAFITLDEPGQVQCGKRTKADPRKLHHSTIRNHKEPADSMKTGEAISKYPTRNGSLEGSHDCMTEMQKRSE